MNFPSINIQGNILSSEIIDKIVSEELKHQEATSFGLKKNERLRDEIGLAWSSIRGLWQTFQLRRERIAAEESGTSETRNFWMLPFMTTLGYDVEKANAEMVDLKSYAISHRAANLQGFPVHIMGVNDSLDKKRAASGPRLSPHALVQEYLNKSEDYLYALVTNGKQLRLLRDSSRLVRLTYLEFDLEKMMDEEIYTDFAILYRLLHASRMPAEKGEGEASVIEYYHQESLSSGTRIREKLSEAVEYAIKELANGFLEQPANEQLRSQIADRTTTADAFYLQSLRLVYRMLFLLVIEDRGLVYPTKLDEESRKKRDIYWKFYSMDRLRRLAAQQQYVEGNKYDLWENLKVSFRLFEDASFAGKLGLQALASGIFHPDALGSFEKTQLSNRHLLEVMEKLCYFNDPSRSTMVKVNYGDLDVEEFGSVYEGLLEYKPVFVEVDSQPVFSFEKGSDRSSSGSHYTPEELVRPLIKHSLDYLIEDCLNKPQERIKATALPHKDLQEQALLSLRVCDVACGSGHILLSAARRIAIELARVRTAEEQPSPTAMRHALRDTIRHTIYGVDKNPLAVELCKVALWLEAHNPGEPLNFLDHHIKCGDSIVGLAHRSELENGIADEAFKSLPGDDKEVASAFRKQNKTERKEREGKATQLKADYEATAANSVQDAMAEYQRFAQMPETTPEQIAKKQKVYQQYLDGRGHQWLKQMADMQVAQFFIPKTNANKPYLLTDAAYRQMLAGYKGWQGQHAAKANVMAQEKRFFHWFIEYPEVFKEGGFDCVLGNPPYLGGKKISTNFGGRYLNYIKDKYEPAEGGVDLVAYFLRRIFTVINNKSFLSLITSQIIKQADTRKGGLKIVLENGGDVCFARTGIKWPGKAGVIVDVFSMQKDSIENRKKTLNGKTVDRINDFFQVSSMELEPFVLNKNKRNCFQGCVVSGSGFMIAEDEYQVKKLNKDIVWPFLIGDEVNNIPSQAPQRRIIYFRDWSLSEARKYPLELAIVKERVKPERDKVKRDVYRKNWWLFAERSKNAYKKINELDSWFVISKSSKYNHFSVQKYRNVIYDQSLTIITLSSIGYLPVLESEIHNSWATKYCSSQGGSNRYNPSDAFHNFPFPINFHEKLLSNFENLGETYHEHRRQLMLSMQLGLTKTYNAFHAPEVQPGITTAALQGKDKKAIEKQYGKELWNLWNHLQKTPDTCTIEEAIAGIQKLRELHIQMDNAVLEAYGWQDVQLRHDFYEVDYLPENDRIRFTIHPDVRKEVLKRLLQLNHQIFEQEAHQGLHKEETVRKFYDQKGEPVPEEVSKWFKKGKAYKTTKTSKPKAKEAEQGYGDLFNPKNE